MLVVRVGCVVWILVLGVVCVCGWWFFWVVGYCVLGWIVCIVIFRYGWVNVVVDFCLVVLDYCWCDWVSIWGCFVVLGWCLDGVGWWVDLDVFGWFGLCLVVFKGYVLRVGRFWCMGGFGGCYCFCWVDLVVVFGWVVLLFVLGLGVNYGVGFLFWIGDWYGLYSFVVKSVGGGCSCVVIGLLFLVFGGCLDRGLGWWWWCGVGVFLGLLWVI